jgi:L-asparaginase / beta-aspartyl-peptidase
MPATAMFALVPALVVFGCAHTEPRTSPVATSAAAPTTSSPPTPAPPATPNPVSDTSPVLAPIQPIVQKCDASPKFTLVVHAGVGYKADEQQTLVLQRILTDGHKLLQEGHAAIDVVQYVVEAMEDSGQFNAGRKGTRTSVHTVELDASIMDGTDLKAGAVASVKDVKNPIRLARAVKDRTRHVLLVGNGASMLADELKMEKVTPDYFLSQVAPPTRDIHHGTVGAVAMDRCGHLSAGTSTGGLFGKHPGRVGDSPLIGAGTYANNKTVAVSCTGEGEKFIRAGVASRISNILQYTKRDLKSAVDESLKLVETLEGSGGLIAINSKGEPLWAATGTEPLPSGMVREDGKLQVRDVFTPAK